MTAASASSVIGQQTSKYAYYGYGVIPRIRPYHTYRIHLTYIAISGGASGKGCMDADLSSRVLLETPPSPALLVELHGTALRA